MPELEPSHSSVPEIEPSYLAVPEQRSFEFSGVKVVKGPPQVLAVSGGLSVLFDDLGVTISGQEPGQRHVMQWADVQRARFDDPMVGSSGRTVTPVEVDSNGSTVRLLLDGDTQESLPVEALERALPMWSPYVPPVSAPDRHPSPGPTNGTAPPPPPVVESRSGQRRPRRPRLAAALLAVLVLIGAGIGLALGLGGHGGGASPTTSFASDQQLAHRIMLTPQDLPVGWTSAPVAADDPSVVQPGQAGVTDAFAGCMGVSDRLAGSVLGSQAPDQTAQATSPIFTAPSTSADKSVSLQLQTAASIVRTHDDEQQDLSLLADGKYAACAATAVASELQAGVNTVAGTHDPPGRAVGAPSSLPSLPGEQVRALQVHCEVSDRGVAVPVEVEVVSVGRGRIEADLEAVSLGGSIPGGVLFSSVVSLEQRVATGGRGVQL